MKSNKWKESLSIAAALVLALVVFLLLLFLLQWNLFLCMGLAAAVYFAMTLILKPVDRIGRVDISSLNNGEMLHEKLGEAGADYARMKKAVLEIRDTELKAGGRELLEIADSILKYLTKNPQKISTARRYIDYYQETAANVLGHYVELQDAKLSPQEMKKTISSTGEAISTLKDAFLLQFDKLVQNEIMDMDADLNLLRQTLRSEGCYEKDKKEGQQ